MSGIHLTVTHFYFRLFKTLRTKQSVRVLEQNKTVSSFKDFKTWKQQRNEMVKDTHIVHVHIEKELKNRFKKNGCLFRWCSSGCSYYWKIAFCFSCLLYPAVFVLCVPKYIDTVCFDDRESASGEIQWECGPNECESIQTIFLNLFG